ncbi:FK506-binding protein 2-like isoform X1 [Glandiceps talaboti]
MIMAEEDMSETEQTMSVDVIYRPYFCGEIGENGKSLTFDYTAYLYGDVHERLEFDSTSLRGKKMIFTMGDHFVMKGWEEGLENMCVGEKRRLIIPPGPMQEGDKGSGAIMPGEGLTLEYEFELVEVSDEAPEPPKPNVFKHMDVDGDKHLSKQEMADFFQESGLGGLKAGETIADAIDTIFEQEDDDADGLISHDEFDGPKHDEL